MKLEKYTNENEGAVILTLEEYNRALEEAKAKHVALYSTTRMSQGYTYIEIHFILNDIIYIAKIVL